MSETRANGDGSQRLLKVAEVAERLRISPKTVRKYIEAGILPVKRLPSGQFRITESSLQHLLVDDARS